MTFVPGNQLIIIPILLLFRIYLWNDLKVLPSYQSRLTTPSVYRIGASMHVWEAGCGSILKALLDWIIWLCTSGGAKKFCFWHRINKNSILYSYYVNNNIKLNFNFSSNILFESFLNCYQCKLIYSNQNCVFK